MSRRWSGGALTTLLMLSILVLGAPSSSAATEGVAQARTATPAAAPFTSGAKFVPVEPHRILDTRAGTGVWGPVNGQNSITLDIAGQPDIPDGVGSVVLNVTAVSLEQWGFVTVHSTDVPLPFASNVNVVAGATAANW